MALNDLCGELRNYFLPNYKEPQKFIHSGTFEIAGGVMQSLPFLRNGQYYRIVGSVFNDGVWRYGDSRCPDDPFASLQDEEFNGAIWEMAVPNDFIRLSDELDTINAKIEAAEEADTGYTSESIGGTYSYSKRAGMSEELTLRRNDVITRLRSQYRRLQVL